MELTYYDLLTISIKAVADTARRKFIGHDGALCGANEKALGVSKHDASAGEQLPVMVYGIAIVTAGGAISAGAPVASNESGLAVAADAVTAAVPEGATPVTSSGAQPDLTVAGGKLPQTINGYALDEASGEGDLIRVKLI